MNLFAINGDVIDGSGSETFYAFGAMALSLALDGVGQAARLAKGRVDIAIDPAGKALLSNLGDGAIQIDTAFEGVGSTVLFGFGQLDLQIIVTGAAADVIQGAGTFPIALSGVYDLPVVQVIPAVYAASPSNRSIAVPEDIRRIAVAADYELTVACQDRTLSIEQEGRRA